MSYGNWKHLKGVFGFHNSSLKIQRIEWWKQSYGGAKQTSSYGSHNFWVMNYGNKVMSYGNWWSKHLLGCAKIIQVFPQNRRENILVGFEIKYVGLIKISQNFHHNQTIPETIFLSSFLCSPYFYPTEQTLSRLKLWQGYINFILVLILTI